jgi:hypothetical protein
MCGIVISSCDRYSDAWGPFFTLFFRYWPDCPFPIYLISTGRQFPDARVTTVPFPVDLGWSGNLIGTLKQITEPYIIYFQEDYFLKAKVDTDQVRSALDFIRNENAAYLRLYRPYPDLPYKNHTLIGAISLNAPYRNCTQTAIWKTDLLLSLLRPGETGWDFELRGGLERSRQLPEPFLAYKQPVINYVCTAILRGEYMWDAVRFCRREGIKLDHKARKFENLLGYLVRKTKLRKHVKRLLRIRTL